MSKSHTRHLKQALWKPRTAVPPSVSKGMRHALQNAAFLAS
jgi:hypothetical protein